MTGVLWELESRSWSDLRAKTNAIVRRRIHVEPSSDFPTIEFDPYELVDDLDKFGQLHVVDDDALCEAYVNALNALNIAQMALIEAAQPTPLSPEEIASFTAARLEWEQTERAIGDKSRDDEIVNVHVTIEYASGYEEEANAIVEELSDQEFASPEALLEFLRKMSKIS